MIKVRSESKTTHIWAKRDWVEVDKVTMVAIKTGVKYVREPETMHWIPESELNALKESVRSELIIRTTKPGHPELIKQQRKTVQIVGERPFSVDYGKIREDDPHADDIHEIAIDPKTGLAYEYRKLDGEDFIKPLLVNVPKKEISLVPQDHSRYTDHVGKRAKIRSRV